MDPLNAQATTQQEASISKSTLSDQATQKDDLGFEAYVQAIADFLVSEDTKPPLTLSIEGEWGSGKSSFMLQLQAKITDREQEEFERPPKIITFNAWRHDKAEALWAAFALSFIRQISKNTGFLSPRIMFGHLKLLRSRLNFRENWLELIQAGSIGIFILSISISLPILFSSAGLDGISRFSNEIDQLFESDSTDQESNSGTNPNPTPSPTAASQSQMVDSQSTNPSSLSKVLQILLTISGVAGTAGGSTLLLVRLRDLIGDPKLDIRKYLESPDYNKEVAFVDQFHQDFKKIVDAYTQKNQKVYVFIDDLDRCEVPKSAELMQAINLMISNDPRIIFIYRFRFPLILNPANIFLPQ